VEHYSLDEYETEVIESLQLARAGLLYFVDMVALHERQKHSQTELCVPLVIPNHHWIRGEDEGTESEA
jgi:hypothetical protein